MKILRALPILLGLAAGSALAQPPGSTTPPQKTPAEKPPTTPPPKMEPVPAGEEMSKADVQRWLGFFDKLVDAVANNANNCDKMAKDVSTVIDKNKPAIDLARNARAQHKKLPVDAQQHMVDGVKKMTPGIQNCGDNEKVKTAFAKLDESQSHAEDTSSSSQGTKRPAK